MAKADGDHADILDSGRWKEAVQAYLASIAFCDAKIGRLLDGLAKIRLQGQHDHLLLGRSRLAPRRETALAKIRPLGRSHPHALHLGRARRDEARRRLRSHRRSHEHLPDALRPLPAFPIPSHVEGASIRPLLADPNATWDTPALTTFHQDNHASAPKRWRYIRYADGGEELYDHDTDPYEWTNLASDPKFAKVKAEIGQHFPKVNHDELPRTQGGQEGEAKKAKTKPSKRPNSRAKPIVERLVSNWQLVICN